MLHQGIRYLLSVCFLAILLAACGPSQPAVAVVPQCTLPASTPNTYQVLPENKLREIYAHVAVLNAPNIGDLYKEARYAAFQELGKSTSRWSDFVDIKLPSSDIIRITVTYLSPQLLDTIQLNQILVDRNIELTDAQFVDRVMAGLANIVQRGELMFLVSITTVNSGASVTNNSTFTAQIPIKQMVLTNASDVMVVPSHDDHSLSENIPLGEPFAGNVTYQMTVKNGETCELLLDPMWNTKISLHVPSLKVNDVDYGPQTWTIQYKPLLDISTPVVPLNYGAPVPDLILTTYTPSLQAPPPSLIKIPLEDSYWVGYWQLMSRYIWEQVTYPDKW